MSGATTFGPDETWPEHPKVHWRAPLAEAREAGWSLRHVDAPHNFGYVACPEGQHTFKVDKTATGGAFFAIEARKAIKRCTHGAGGGNGKVRARVATATALLTTADLALDVATQGLDAIESQLGAWGIVAELDAEVERIRIQLATASLSVEEALSGEIETPFGDNSETTAFGDDSVDLAAALTATEARLDAELAAADDLGAPPAIEDVAGAVDEASVAVDEAESVTRKLRKPSIAEPLRARAEAARDRITSLRVRLADLQERSRPTDG